MTEAGFAAISAPRVLRHQVPRGRSHAVGAVIVHRARAEDARGVAATRSDGRRRRGRAGARKLEKHVENVRQFGVPAVVAINITHGGHRGEVKTVLGQRARSSALPARIACVVGRRGRGRAEVAGVTRRHGHGVEVHGAYPDEAPLEKNIETIAPRGCTARTGSPSSPAATKLKRFAELGFGALPVCMAKTQNSLSDDARKIGRPRDFTVTIRDAKVAAGAGFVVAYAGDILTMPGLPKVPAAEAIDLDEQGNVVGLF